MHIRILLVHKWNIMLLYIDNYTVSWKYVLGDGIQLDRKWNIK